MTSTYVCAFFLFFGFCLVCVCVCVNVHCSKMKKEHFDYYFVCEIVNPVLKGLMTLILTLIYFCMSESIFSLSYHGQTNCLN